MLHRNDVPGSRALGRLAGDMSLNVKAHVSISAIANRVLDHSARYLIFDTLNPSQTIPLPLESCTTATVTARVWSLDPYRGVVPMVHDDESGAKEQPVRRGSAVQ